MQLPGHIEETAQQIEELEIQGATAVAVESVKALQRCWKEEQDDELLHAAADRLLETRPTEPGLQNAVHVAVGAKRFDTALEHFADAKDAINEEGLELFEDGMTVFTHCHSSTAEGAIIHAHERDTELRVRNTETRPVFQGRKTARNLAGSGIEVVHTVDSAAETSLAESDIMAIGADAVTADGTLYNKIGSLMMARSAQTHDVPVYVFTDSWKFAAQTLHGGTVEIEQRDPEEVWPDPPAGVDVRNPAFDAVPAELIDGIVTELGILEPTALADAVLETYPALDPETY